jgi:2-furoyl-CoA dehydrogenase large subunit
LSVTTPPNERDEVDSSATYGFVADVVAVEIDPETGALEILRYASVHDAGRILNPLLVEGQIYGAALHGIGGALYEELAYGPDGQLLTGSLMDYLCPTALEAPELAIEHVETPSPLTLLGAKGVGEGNAMSAPPAVANAVADALRPLGVSVTKLPIRPDWLRGVLRAGGL